MTDEELIAIYEQATGFSFPPEFVLRKASMEALRALFDAGRVAALEDAASWASYNCEEYVTTELLRRAQVVQEGAAGGSSSALVQ